MPANASELVEARRAALEGYEAEELPSWRRSGFWTTSLRGLELDALEPRRYEPGLPELDLGDDEHAALIVQRGASIVHADVQDERIVVMPLEQAVVGTSSSCASTSPSGSRTTRASSPRALRRSGPAGCSSTSRRRSRWRSRSRWSG